MPACTPFSNRGRRDSAAGALPETGEALATQIRAGRDGSKSYAQPTCEGAQEIAEDPVTYRPSYAGRSAYVQAIVLRPSTKSRVRNSAHRSCRYRAAPRRSAADRNRYSGNGWLPGAPSRTPRAHARSVLPNRRGGSALPPAPDAFAGRSLRHRAGRPADLAGGDFRFPPQYFAARPTCRRSRVLKTESNRRNRSRSRPAAGAYESSTAAGCERPATSPWLSRNRRGRNRR